MLSEITPLILTYNEAPNIGRTLEKLTWAKEIVVVDSFSTDETLDIIKRFPHARIVQRKFDEHTSQWNFGLDQTRTSWVLSLDADYVLSNELVEELGRLPLSAREEGRGEVASGLSSTLDRRPSVAAFHAHFRYCINGRPLRASLYPPRAVLFRRDTCRYEKNGHTQWLKISGNALFLQSPILHDDRKPLDRWLHEQSRYARLEAEHLLNTPSSHLSFADRLRRKIVIAPLFVFFYTLFGKGLVLDGRPGLYYVLQRTIAELLLSLRLIEAKLLKTEDRRIKDRD